MEKCEIGHTIREDFHTGLGVCKNYRLISNWKFKHFGMNVLTRVISTLVLEIGNAHLSEENIHKLPHVRSCLSIFNASWIVTVSHLHKTTKGQVVVSNDTLDLVEFSQMRSVDGFVTEHTIDGEVTGWWRTTIGAFLLRQLVQHVGADSCGVRSKDELLRLFSGPGISVAYRAIFALLYVQLALV